MSDNLRMMQQMGLAPLVENLAVAGRSRLKAARRAGSARGASRGPASAEEERKGTIKKVIRFVGGELLPVPTERGFGKRKHERGNASVRELDHPLLRQLNTRDPHALLFQRVTVHTPPTARVPHPRSSGRARRSADQSASVQVMWEHERRVQPFVGVVTAVRPTSLGGTALDLHVEYLDGDDRWEMDDDVLLATATRAHARRRADCELEVVRHDCCSSVIEDLGNLIRGLCAGAAPGADDDDGEL